MKTKLIISGLAFLVMTTLSYGQNSGTTSPPQNGKGDGIAYVDANKNGICDNYENRTLNGSPCKKSGNINSSGDGQSQWRGQKGWCRCQNQAQGKGRGRYFTDANNNGVCDNYEIPSKK